MNNNYTFREINGLTGFLKLLLWLGAGMAVVSMSSSIMQAALLNHDSFTASEGEANDLRERIIGLAQLALYVFTAIIFGRWIVRANRNVRALGAENLSITPGWAVGYFFIPIFNLWRPYHAMKDLWRASHNPTGWAEVAVGSVLAGWWTLWLVSNFLGQMSFRMMTAAKDLAGLKSATHVQIVSEVVDVVLCLVAIALVSQIANAQQTHAQTNAGSTSCEGIQTSPT
jgi:hypothetical protein